MFEIPQMLELEFDAVKHYYKLNGRYIPSVTTIMRPLTADLYKDIDEAIMKVAADRGTAIHELIENYIKFGWAEPSNEYELYFKAFTDWFTAKNPQTIASELKVYSPMFRYAGTCDYLAIINGHLTLTDFKTTATLHEHLVKTQLEAYARAYIEHGVPVEYGCCLQLKKDGTYNQIVTKIGNSEAWSVFSSLLNVYNYIQKNKNWGKK